MKMDKKSDRLTYEDFLSVFDEGHPTHFGSAPKDHPYPQVENPAIASDACIEKMKKKILVNLDHVKKVCTSIILSVIDFLSSSRHSSHLTDRTLDASISIICVAS